MPKSENQKLKLLYLMQIFKEKTDENHCLSLAEIQEQLKAYDIAADRKTLYTDFEDLRRFGMDIISEQQGRSVVYHLVSRDFELAELKLLVDTVQAAKFITERKSRALIKKLEGLVSEHEAKKLQRQVLITGRVKTNNEAVLINVDAIHDAINRNEQISFKYFQWTVAKKLEAKQGGALYTVSPWYLLWDDENYYLVAYDSSKQEVRHYRVDKMKNIACTGTKREGQKKLRELDIASYSKRTFGMFSGEPVRVTMECKESMAGVIIDRFGKEVTMLKKPDGFTAIFDAVPSGQFIGWVVSLGSEVKVTAPKELAEEILRTGKMLVEAYSE